MRGYTIAPGDCIAVLEEPGASEFHVMVVKRVDWASREIEGYDVYSHADIGEAFIQHSNSELVSSECRMMLN
jgi:hypothetical protein